MSYANQYVNSHNSSSLEMSPMYINEAATTNLYTYISDASLVQKEETVNHANGVATTNMYTTISDASLAQRYETINHVNGAATTNPNTAISDASLGQREETFKRTPYRRLCCFAVIILLTLGVISLAIIGIIHLSEPSKHQDHPTTTQGPTTTTTPPPTSQFINCTDETAFIGKSVTLTCNVTVAFDYINVTKATRNLADVTSVGNVINRNLNTGEHVVFGQSHLQITYESVECDDGGLFTLFVQKTGGSTASQAVTLSIWAKPKSVSMTLHADFVINTDRLGSEHVCEGFVGYPGGQLEVTMTKQGDPNVYSVPLADYDGSRAGGNTMTTENCNNKARLEFGLQLGTEWRNGTITCRAKNRDVLEDGDVEQNDTAILYLIPADFCSGENDDTFKANPYSCNKFVQCSNDLSFGGGCGEQCYTGLSVAPLCGDCQTYPCTTIPTTTTTTTQATTTPPPDVFATCSGANSLIGSSATVTCSVNKDTFSYINVTFTPSKTQTSSHVVDIHPTGVVNDDSGANRDVTVSNAGKDITIALTSLACSDEGVFHLNVFAISGDSSTTASVSVRDTPKTNPTLTPATRVATGLALSPDIKCSGETGYPSGIIYLQIKYDGSSSFVSVTEFTKTESSTDGDCAVTKEASYSGTPTMAVNGSYIRCATSHPDAVNTLFSAEERLLVIDGNLCNGKRDGAILYHPYSCGQYVQCANNFVHVSNCGVAAPCIRINETSATGYCASTCAHCPSYHIIIPNTPSSG